MKKHEYMPGWYWFCPCGKKPVRLLIGTIPAFPYRHFDTFEDCQAAIDEFTREQ